MQNAQNPYIRSTLTKLNYFLRFGLPFMLLVVFVMSGCSKRPLSPRKQYGIQDQYPETWIESNQRIERFVSIYRKNTHVRICLQRAEQKGYLHYIHRVFYKYRLPPELAHLPILESCFDTRANSGSALGMWQFTKATATDYGLRVGWFSDDRLNWRKATHSAARYLNELGRRFNYDWRLALAGYNGGPNYLDKIMENQRSRNFWKLKLRKETKEYVPKFLAMLKVGRERYPDLFFQGAPRYWVASR